MIPDTATIEGTARTLHDSARRQVRAALQRRCEGIAAANDCAAEFEWFDGYPSTINDPAMADFVAKTARDALGAASFIPAARPAMGGEDFAYYLQHVPGCFFFVGVEPKEAATYPPLHNERYDFTDAALGVGMRMFLELVVRSDGML